MNSKVPFSVKVYVFLPLLFVIIISSDSSVKVAITSDFVFSVVLYLTLAVGSVLSIQSTVAVTSPFNPYSSTNSNVKLPFSLNLYVFLPSLLVIVSGLFSLTSIATTSIFVGVVIS